tara:strand:- start:962 stop:1405 length:444 start_codon:yes stop_codon:yes gene_type:complete
MAESKKSLYKPSNPRKYKGNVHNIICRSSWEERFCNYCDLNENIVEWGSEEFFIPYRAPDGKSRRYFPDFIMKVKENTGKVKTYVIEVKPFKQTKPPKKRKNVTKSYMYECKTYAVNQAKWIAANEWCKDHGVEFKIITERELGIRS